MKKIVHIFNSIEYSGAEKMVLSLSDFYNENFISYAMSTGEAKGEFYDNFSSYFKTVHLPIPDNRNLNYIISFFKLVYFYKREKINIVHIHPSRRFFYHVIAAKIGGVNKIIRQVHNNFYFEGLIKLKEKISRIISIKLGVKIVTIGKSVYENEANRFGIKTTLINNFFDEDKIFPCTAEKKLIFRNKLGIPVNSFCIISVGVCTDRKQHNHIIETLQLLYREIPNIYYIHLGEGSLCDEEKKLAIELGVSERILFAGNQDNVLRYLQASDIYVMTSQIEGLSISTIEAMGARLPTVLYNNPGLKELGEYDAPAILVDDNSLSLSTKLRQLNIDSVYRENTAEKCYNFAVKVYTKRKAKQSWGNIYEIKNHEKSY